MVFDKSLHFEVNNDYHCAKWMKSDPEESDNLRCRVSNDVSFCTYLLVDIVFSCVSTKDRALFTIAVTLLVYVLDRKCNSCSIQEHIRRYRERPIVKCIHCAMIPHLEEVAG